MATNPTIPVTAASVTADTPAKEMAMIGAATAATRLAAANVGAIKPMVNKNVLNT